MKKLLLFLAAAVPLFSQVCSYSFSPIPTQSINIPAAVSTTPNTITVTTPAGCPWTFGTDSTWITFPGSTTQSRSGTDTINWVAAANPGPGQRSGRVFVTDGVVNYTTAYTVIQAAPACTLTLNPALAEAAVGGGTGTIQVQTNCTWTAGSTTTFITLSSGTSGTLNGAVQYTVAPNVCADARSGSILVQASGSPGASQQATINQDGSPNNLTLAPNGLAAPSAGTDGRVAITTGSVCAWLAFSDSSWITLNGATSGTGSGSVAYHIQANPSVARTGSIHVGPQLFTVVQQAPPPPPVELIGVLNAASGAGGAVSPGEIVSVWGTNIGPVQGVPMALTPDSSSITKSLGGTQVFFDGVAAPLLYASAVQVNAIVPYAVSGSTQVQVQYQGTSTNKLTLTVQAATPGIFSLDASGTGGGAILNQDYSINNPLNPAVRGTQVMIYCTGGGVTDPASVDAAIIGVPAPALTQPVTVTIGGITAQVKSSGAISYAVAGLTQVTAIVPANVIVGTAVPVVVQIGNWQSQAGITVAVE